MTTVRDAASALLEALDPTDLDIVVSRFHSRDELLDTMQDCAEKVRTKLAGSGSEVKPDEYGHLTAATLTWGAEHAGVQASTGHARTKFEYYRCFPRLAPHRLLLLNRGDDPAVIALLEATAPVLDAVSELRSAVPEELRTIVATAVVARGVTAGPGTVQDGVQVVAGVLDRAAELAVRHRIERGPLPGSGLVVRGNTDLLVLVAAYRRAIDERITDPPPGDPIEQIAQALPELERRLRVALTYVPSREDREAPDEPDALYFYSVVAEYLGSRAEVRKVADRLSTRLRRLRLTRDRRWVPTEEMEPAAGGFDDDPARQVATPDHITRWVLAALFDPGRGPDGEPSADERVAHDDREAVRRWLTGEPGNDVRDDLELLLGRMRRAMTVLVDLPSEDTPDGNAPKPEGMRPEDHLLLVARLSTAVTAALQAGIAAAHEPVRLISAVLPPLWTDRAAAAHLLAARIRARQTRKGAAAKVEASLIAATISRAPGQVLHRAETPRHGAGCSTTHVAGGVRCGERTGPPPAEAVVCPIRAWGEIGFVESYLTLAELTDVGSPDSVRQRLRRYQGPLAELLHLGSP